MSTWSVTDARAALPEILDRVSRGDEVTLTRHGRAVAVVIAPEALRTRRASSTLREASTLSEQLAEARVMREPPPPAIDEAWATELVVEIRADRDSGG